jgi:hypothetical protein
VGTFDAVEGSFGTMRTHLTNLRRAALHRKGAFTFCPQVYSRWDPNRFQYQ